MINNNKRLVLIDGHAILHRAYHAYPPLTTSKGELVNAVYGFTSILLSTLHVLHPEYVAVAFDLGKPTFRHKKFKAYKAHRPKVDRELIEQIPRTHEVVEVLNIPIFEKIGFEADDVIGTLARLASKTLEVIIVTGDNDALQLIDNNTKVFMPGRGKKPALMVDRKAFLQKFCFEPRQLVDYKALVGDASDGIPGVSGIGPKTATNLIIKFDSLEQIYNNIAEIDPKVGQKLLEQKDQAFLSYNLAEIVTKVPLKLKLDQVWQEAYNFGKVEQLFGELEFKTLIKRLPGYVDKKQTKESKPKDKNKQMGLF